MARKSLVRVALSLAIAGAACSSCTTAAAQPRSAAVDEAVGHLQKAMSAANAQNWETALAEYDASNRASPSIAAQAGIADAHYQLRHDAEAADAYNKILAAKVDLPADQPAVRSQWEALQQTARTRLAEIDARKNPPAASTTPATKPAKKPAEKRRHDDDDEGDSDDDDPSKPRPDGGRFRFGINPTLGLETVSASGNSVSGAMYGLDLRLGWQVNHLLAIYAQPHLSFGTLGTNGVVSGFTGTLTGTVMAEATFFDLLFVGAGAGYGVLNNPSGPTIEGRFGVYPIVGRGSNGIRRKGLMVGGDIRAIFVDGATGTLLMGCIGYEAF